VLSAVDGAAGIATLQAESVDLVLLDLMLTKIDALAMCRWARAHEEAVYRPIIMLTALNRPAERQAGFAAGADDYIGKPFDIDDLLARVQAWLRTRERLSACHARVVQQQATLQGVERQAAEATLRGVRLTAREVAHRLNNELTLGVGLLSLLRDRSDCPDDLRDLVDEAAAALGRATADIERLQQVARVETRDTPMGPSLDLERSSHPDVERPS